VIGLLLLVVTYQIGEHIINAIFPLYEWMIRQFDYRFDTIIFTIITQHGEQFLLLQVMLSQSIIVGTEIIELNYPILSAVTMPLGNVLLPIVLIFTIVLAWPIELNHHVMRIYVVRIVLALPLCVFIMLLDIPTQLTKMVWESLNKLLNLSISSDLPYFTFWSDFLNGGGLIALSITSGLLVVAFVDLIPKFVKPGFLNAN
jgi:hypothetical protein